MVSARRSERSWLNASLPTPSVWPATTKVEPFRLGFDSALPSSCTAWVEVLLIAAELKSKLISRSMFGLVDAISAICSRSPSDSDRVLRLRTVLMKLISFALIVGSAFGPIDRPRGTGFGCHAPTILLAG